MPPAAASLDGFNVHHARLFGGAARRGQLEAGLAALRVTEIIGDREILLVRHLRAAEPIKAGMPSSLFAARLSDQLRRVAGEALVNPTGAVPYGRAFRFTSHDRYVAWLILTWLKPTSPQAREMLSELLNGQSVEHWQRRIVLNDGKRIISLVRALSVQRSAAAWAKRLAPEDCFMAIQALGRAFGFEPAAFAVAAEGGHEASVSLAGASPIRPPIDYILSRTPVTRRSRHGVALALQQLVESVSTSLGGELAELPPIQQAFLLTCLVLAESPNTGPLFDGNGWQSLAPPANDATVATIKPMRAARASSTRHTSTKSAELRHGEGPAHVRSYQSNVNTRSEASAYVKPGQAVLSPLAENATDIQTDATPPATCAFSPIVAPVARTAQRVDTEFGGVIFVLNILLALNLYPDFTKPLGRRLEPSPLWLLSQLGGHLFGKSFRRDPLFALLRDAGQSGELPEEWHIGPEWMGPLRQLGSVQRVFDGKNLTTFDARGFIWSDIRAKPWSRQAVSATRHPRRVRAIVLPAKRDDRWVACLGAFIRFRMACAAPGLDVAALRLPARAELTDDGLDVYFSLTRLPLAVRMAGLDRNPGWLPSEGRSISFHFS